MIDFIQPYSYDLRIGEVYTEAIRKCNGWICITDQDTLKPPGFAERIKKVIEAHGNTSRLFGAMTNRVGWGHEAIVPDTFLEDSITNHLSVAKRLWEKNETDITKTRVVPGYCMVFHRELADKWLPFEPRTITFDRWASDRSECYLMQGVYIIHLYRWGVNKETHRKVEHLGTPGYYLQS